MHISFNTEDKFSDQDLRILAILAEPATDTIEVAAVAGPAATRTEEEADKPKADKPKAELPQDPAEEPAEEPTQEAGGHTLSEAVEVATQLVSSGKTADVKKALSSVGAKRVGQIPADKVDEFLVALNA